MTGTVCAVEWCDRPLEDGYVCSLCARKHDERLAAAVSHAQELETTLAKLRTNFSVDSGRSSEKPLPLLAAAVEASYVLRNTLTTWVRLVIEERGYLPNDGMDRMGYPWSLGYAAPRQRLIPGHDRDSSEPSMAHLAAWLLPETEWLRHQRFGHEAVEEIDYAVAQVKRIVDRPPVREYVGPCRDCGADIYAKQGAAKAECRPCGLEYDVAEMREWMKDQVYGRLVTAREGSALLSRFGLETRQGTIDTWVQRKRLVPKGHNPEGRRLYLFDDLVALAARAQRPDTPEVQVAV